MDGEKRKRKGRVREEYFKREKKVRKGKERKKVWKKKKKE
jgi:hypothetical protein